MSERTRILYNPSTDHMTLLQFSPRYAWEIPDGSSPVKLTRHQAADRQHEIEETHTYPYTACLEEMPAELSDEPLVVRASALLAGAVLE